MQWNHLCFSYNGKQKRVRIVANGGQATVDKTNLQLPGFIQPLIKLTTISQFVKIMFLR